MAEERDIEKQLRAAAEQRRREAGAPFELHPTTRRLLQDEVRRVYSRPTVTTPKTSLLASWRFRAAVGACVVILAAAICIPILSGSKKGHLQFAQSLGLRERALTESARNRPSSPPPASTPAPVVSPSPSRGDEEKNRLIAARKAAATEAEAQSSTWVATNAIAPGLALNAKPAELSVQPAQQNLFFRNAGVPAGLGPTSSGESMDKLAKADFKRSLNDQTKGAIRISPLAVFQMQQTGNRLRITDSDGSVYNGTLMVAAAETSAVPPVGAGPGPAGFSAGEKTKQFAEPVRRQGMLVQGNLAWQQNQNFRFKAAGTNLSLNQRVTISGEFIAVTNLAFFLESPRAGAGGGTLSTSTVNQPQSLSNGRIVGKAVLDNGQEIPLNATSVTP